MKIIAHSNFDDEMVNDVLICENVNEHYLAFILAHLQEQLSRDEAYYFFKSVKDDYKLHVFEP